MSDVANGSLWLSLVISLYAVVALALAVRTGRSAWRDSGRNAALAAMALVSLAAVILFYLLISKDLHVRYVYQHVTTYQPLLYTIAAFWAGQEGSLLLWLWLVSLLTGLIAWQRQRWDRVVWPHLTAVLASFQAFLLFVLLTQSNPFATFAYRPAEGLGLNPLLENFWMVIHPPVVFAGYALYSVPFALVVGGLLAGKLQSPQWEQLRRWNLYGWLFLSAGILLGALWAYLELGWGGYWGWDPVENSSLVPWLTGTAALHAAIAQRRRGMFQLSMLLLTVATFLLCLFATFVTRSGLIQSVHAFARSSIGYIFLAFLAAAILLVALLLYRRRSLYAGKYEITSLVSREAAFLLVNLLLVGTALVVLLGTLFPTLSEVWRGVSVALNASFYVRVTAPLFVALLALLGVCPLIGWGQASLGRVGRQLLIPGIIVAAVVALLLTFGVRQPAPLLSAALSTLIASVLVGQFLRDARARRARHGTTWPASLAAAFRANQRRYGAHLVHLALVLIVIGVTGSSVYKYEQLVTLREGETATVQGYDITYLRPLWTESPHKVRSAALVELSRGGRHIAYLTPERNWHANVNQWVTEVAIRTSLAADVYLVLGDIAESGQASLQVLINPLLVWIWVGGFLLLLGTAIVLLTPSRATHEAEQVVSGAQDT